MLIFPRRKSLKKETMHPLAVINLMVMQVIRKRTLGMLRKKATTWRLRASRPRPRVGCIHDVLLVMFPVYLLLCP